MARSPRFLKLFAYSTIPVLAALGTGLWLAERIHGDPAAAERGIRTEEVIAQDRLLVDAVWSAIETVKVRSLSLARVRSAEAGSAGPLAQPEGMLLHWAELETRDGRLAGVRQVGRNAAFMPPSGWAAFESYYLKAALSRIDLGELAANGVSLLRIKQDPGRSQEWLALAFAEPASGVVLALVDPGEAFPVFHRWTSRSEGGNLRGYLVGSDGFVLAHSQRPYVASDFSGTQVFRQGVRQMFTGRQLNGAGTFKGIDHLPVTVAYARPGTLPIGAVVERVVDGGQVNQAGAPLAWLENWRDSLKALLALALLAVLSALGVRKLLGNAQAGEARPEAPFSPEAGPGIRRDVPQEERAPQAAHPVVPESSARVAAPESRLPVFEADLPEIQLFQDLLSDRAGEARARALHAHRVWLARFDVDSRQEAGAEADARSIFQNLADKVSRMAGLPALCFTYHPKLRAAMLTAWAGLSADPSPTTLSFRLTDGALGRIRRYHEGGRVASLSDDPNLGLLLAKNLGSSRCEAWPVAGSGGELLGVLAVAGSFRGAASPSLEEGICALLKMAGALIEAGSATPARDAAEGGLDAPKA